MSILNIIDLNKQFVMHTLGGKHIEGFGSVSFDVAGGQVVWLAGPSGIGKSSLLKCIYRTYLPSSGHIHYKSALYGRIDLAAAPEHQIIRLRQQEIGFVSQFLNVLPRVAAADVVAEPLVNHGVDRQVAHDTAVALLAELNIPKTLHDAYPVTFSGGEQQRVNIARAVITRPRLLLLDEPTASLDKDALQRVLDLLNRLRGQGTTMVMICHDSEVARQMADMVVYMSPEGRRRPHRSAAVIPENDNDLLIANGNLVLKDRVAESTDLVIRKGKIAHIGPCPDNHRDIPRMDADGLLVMPGFIDLHSDAIEKSLQPRPRALLPMEMALTELDKVLASCGITTMFHCVGFTGKEDNQLRYYKQSADIVRQIKTLAPGMLVRTCVHARYEILETGAIPLLEALMAEGLLDLVSLMDHTPGQGQFRDKDHLYEYYSKAVHLSREQIDRLIDRRLTLHCNFDDTHVRKLVGQCHLRRIPVASHDDDTVEKVAWIHDMGVQISEFPVTMEAAREASRLGIQVLMGGPNIFIGRSLSQNLSGRDAIEAGCCHLIGSDYSPSSILHAVFKLEALGMGTLPEIVQMASLRPAQILGQSDQLGAIAEGLSADLVAVDRSGHTPRIVRTLVEGRQVYAGRM